MTKSETIHRTETETVIPAEATFGLGELRIAHPPGTFAVTPASSVGIDAIVQYQQLLAGIGSDWGSGSGVLAILAAKIESVERVFGLEIDRGNVDIAQENARLNNVADKVQFVCADSFAPFEEDDRSSLTGLQGQVNFVLANPPWSEGDDGFSFRRRVLRESREFLVNGGVVFLNVSLQYGQGRIQRLSEEISGYTHRGVLSSTDWVPFDLDRPDLMDSIQGYVEEERRGGLEYEFTLPNSPVGKICNARSALSYYRDTGASPLSKWQTHLFAFCK